jgi:hypothetical protein
MLHHAFSIAFCYAFIGIIEYLAHRYPMHRPTLSKYFGDRIGYLKRTYSDHAVLHHSEYYSCFNYEEDPVGKFQNLRLTAETTVAIIVLFALPMFFIDQITGIYLGCAAIIHAALWNLAHSEMHLANKPWFARTALYRLLEWHHFLHHQHPNKNFNVLFLLWDILFATRARATAVDLDVWRKLQSGARVDRRGRLMVDASTAGASAPN